MADLAKITEALEGRKVLFLGQTRTMSDEDIDLFLSRTGAQRAENEADEPIAMIVMGRLVNPLEEAYADKREKEGIPVVALEELERFYAATIDPQALLGSLALFPNQSRIVNLLHNRSLPDDLFCDILALYDWGGAEPFENDTNRDVAGTLVQRFYPEIEKNHNIQYSPLGPFLVAAQCDFAPLLAAMATIPDYEVSQRSRDPWMPRTLHESLLINPALPAETVARFAANDDERLQGFAAAHPHLGEALQRRLAVEGSEWVLEGLAQNPRLLPELGEKLLRSGAEGVRCAYLRSQPLSDETIDEVLDRGSEPETAALGANEKLSKRQVLGIVERAQEPLLLALAANESLSEACYEALERKGGVSVARILAANPSLSPERLQRLTRIRDKALFVALAGNPAMPSAKLAQFAQIKDRDIHKALAANPSTPIEILLGYQMDGELNQILKRNEAYGEYIRQNLGM
ncbi:hypothetical protein [Hydrogenimonas sp.]